MRPRRRPSALLPSQGLQTWLVATAAVVILGVFAAAGGYLYFNKRSLDRETGCPTDHYDSITVALVDLTDPISPVQAAALSNALHAVRDAVPKFGRFEIYPLTSTRSSVIEPLFAGCSPGSGRDVDSRLYGNPELADRTWKKRFGEKVDGVVADLQRAAQQETSPLFEGVQSVAVTAFGKSLSEGARDKRVVIFSDMIHHTSDLSMYQGAPVLNGFDPHNTTCAQRHSCVGRPSMFT